MIQLEMAVPTVSRVCCSTHRQLDVQPYRSDGSFAHAQGYALIALACACQAISRLSMFIA